MGRAIGSPSLPLRRDARESAAWLVIAVASAALLSWVTVWSLAAGLTLVLVVSIVVAYAAAPRAGAVALWVLWLVAPLLRRLFDLFELAAGPDVLAIAPFAATLGVAAVAYVRTPPSPRARMVLGLAAAGLLLGVPIGISDPTPTAFALFAYGAGVSAFVIGYGEQRRTGADRLELGRLLVFLVPLVAVYGAYQAAFPLPRWDALWVETSDLVSIGRKDLDNFRVFSTLNSPVTLAAVLSAFIGAAFVARRLGPAVAIALVLAFLCLALTSVRSAWVAVTFAMLLALALTRGRRLGLVAIVASLVVGAAVFAGDRSPLGATFVERVQSFESLGSDVSAQKRLETTSVILPEALRAPLGQGLGSVGQARRLSDAPRGRDFPDNGWLATLYQLGPFGFLLVIGSLAGAALWGYRRADPRRRAEARTMAAMIVATLLVLHVSTDILYGITGAIVWYGAGALFGMGERGTAAPAG